MTTDIITYGIPEYCAEIIIKGKRYCHYLKGDNLTTLEAEAKNICRQTKGARYLLFDAFFATSSTINLCPLGTSEVEVEVGFDDLGIEGW